MCPTTSTTDNSTISAGLVQGLLDFVKGCGLDPKPLAEAVGIDFKSRIDPDGRMPLSVYVNLLQAAKLAAGDPALALRYGEQVGMSLVSIVGLIMEASPTMGEAFAQMQRYNHITTEIDNVHDSPRFVLTMQEGKLLMLDQWSELAQWPELIEGAFARLVCGPRRFLSEPHVLAAHFAHPEPSYVGVYEEVFKCPLKFNAKQNALQLHPEITSWKVAQSPQYVFGVLTQHADGLLAELDAPATGQTSTTTQSASSAKNTKNQVEETIKTIAHMGEVTIDMVASRLGMSRQTLFRKLAKEGTSFTKVLRGLRESLAKQYLSETEISVNEVAYLIGFSESAAFSRAFKRWTNRSPGEYRNRDTE